MFQFLIGSLETVYLLFFYFFLCIVSNPYRQSRNLIYNHIIILYLKSFNSLQVVQKLYIFYFSIFFYVQFQFLIGSLETGSYINIVWICFQFQFLIGSLETQKKCLGGTTMEIRFQFLIGSLETLSCIPRINTNFTFQFLIGSLETFTCHISVASQQIHVSIPYRQSRNAQNERDWLVNPSKFQFLIGSLETTIRI